MLAVRCRIVQQVDTVGQRLEDINLLNYYKPLPHYCLPNAQCYW